MTRKEIILGIGLAVALIALAYMIAIIQQPSTPKEPEWSEEYWNQVHVSEYLAEKLSNGSAMIIRAGLGRVVVNINGTAYEYQCAGAFNCTERIVNETLFFVNGREEFRR